MAISIKKKGPEQQAVEAVKPKAAETTVAKVTKPLVKNPVKAVAKAPSEAQELEVTVAQGVGTTTKEFSSGGVEDTHEVVSEVTSKEALAKVEVSIGVTRNLGNYESVKIHVGITLPCPPTEKDINDTYNEAKGWVDARIEQINQEVSAELGK